MTFYNWVKNQVDKFIIAILDPKTECNTTLQFIVITKTENPTITYQQTHKGSFTSDKRLAIQSQISTFIQNINAETITNSEKNGLDFYVKEFTDEVYKELIKYHRPDINISIGIEELHATNDDTIVSSTLVVGNNATTSSSSCASGYFSCGSTCCVTSSVCCNGKCCPPLSCCNSSGNCYYCG